MPQHSLRSVLGLLGNFELSTYSLGLFGTENRLSTHQNGQKHHGTGKEMRSGEVVIYICLDIYNYIGKESYKNNNIYYDKYYYPDI